MGRLVVVALGAALVAASACTRAVPPESVRRSTDAGGADASATVTPPPPPPSALTARPESPFAARLSWVTDARDAAGFEIQMKVGDDFVRAALVGPTERAYVHHLLVPGQRLTYRVRAFHAGGASAPSPVASLTMPERVAPVSPGAKPPPMGPCVAPVRQAPRSSGCDPEISTLKGENGRVLSNVPGAGNGCARHLMGEYAGCTRELGVFELQADIVVVPGHFDEGWPLLHAVAGAGQYTGAQIHTLRFTKGRYVIADEAHVCGESPEGADGDPSLDTPFTGCQLAPAAL